jgi:hypothetical protein
MAYIFHPVYDMRDFVIFIISGIVGTWFITGAMYLLSAMTGKNYKVVRILGTMLSDRIMGVLLHFMIGIFFAFIYFYLWQADMITHHITSSILFGAVAGVIAMIFWRSFLHLHPAPPPVPVATYVLAIGLAHIVFSLGIFLVYEIFLPL